MSSLGGPDPLLEVHEPEGGHLGGGTFDSDTMLAELDAWSATAPTSCRVVGDMGWAERTLGHAEQMDALFSHEVNAGVWASRRSVYVLCFYDLNVFGGEVIVPMVKAHPQSWMGGVLLDNPYHQRGHALQE
ncbi:MEDS domain-containing protein [Lentzea aerocolonigenes]|uniref:MEDS domain-containing protein n=1 Tax=Lentzea aerocolonigenes TaxID=68170 RepID=UPI0004C44C38|nr:MEDS domain-containing protein [Lentzea aerocolonigenes]MCP2242417.1 MEDS: MEthanogen/methylotroph, DcmR Sensory domain [Lentzea aerocolonigenes]